ncbi:hypothetical protein MBH78_07410 [Oceanimonas sp. NS1]|nr:hypothetical protein [Oceanimonas sp. NS1]
MMTAEQSFNRWVRIALITFGVLLVYFVLIDNYAPMTPQAQAHRPVLSVGPRVAGQVTEVAVSNNQQVATGSCCLRWMTPTTAWPWPGPSCSSSWPPPTVPVSER